MVRAQKNKKKTGCVITHDAESSERQFSSSDSALLIPVLFTYAERPTSPMCDFYARHISILVWPKLRGNFLSLDSLLNQAFLHTYIQNGSRKFATNRAEPYPFYQQVTGLPLFPNLLVEFNYPYLLAPFVFTRNWATFTNRADITYRQSPAFMLRSWCHAIMFLFMNVVQSQVYSAVCGTYAG